jgi:hypothetical protein
MSAQRPVPIGRRRVAAPAVQRGRADLLRWTARIGAVTADALALLDDVSVASASSRLVAAGRDGLLTRHRLLIAAPAIYTATASGVRAAGVAGLEPVRISVANAPHTLACAHAAAALQRRYPDHLVGSERELRRDERQAGAPLASAVLARTAGDRTTLHRPDLVLWPQGGREGAPIAIEVELAVKAPRRLTEICRAWARAREIEGVLYLASPAARRALNRAVEQAAAGERVTVVALETLSPGGV